MEQPVQKSGMPRGCFVALIIVGVLAVILIIVFALICMNRDKVFQMSTRQAVNFYKEQLNQKPVEGIDTTQFDRLADTFLVRLQTTKLPDTTYLRLITSFQGSLVDKKITAKEATDFADEATRLFPDLAPYGLTEPTSQTPAPADSTFVPEDSTTSHDTVMSDTVH